MKKVIHLTIGLILVSSFSVFSQEVKTENFKVFGNCGMCESRIEKAASDLDGVSKAHWDKETKMLAVSFDESKIKTNAIHKAVAKVGHDTKKEKASDEVYNSLAGCCKYEREAKPESKKE